ncbi:MAG: ACT domain-containing protein [Candidatus Diapherotrites archaeon]|nr:ACT domain-containing protein [Candidatus Diapherotrites archaeon]
MVTTSELTEKFINEHVSVKDCLKKGLLNYSALSRLIAGELDIEKETSKEAILVAARRYKDKMKTRPLEDSVFRLFEESDIEIKNRVYVYTLEKSIYPDALIDLEKQVKNDKCMVFSIEGTKTITVMIQKRYRDLVEKSFKGSILNIKKELSLVTITSPGIEQTRGALSYLTGLFFENGINILEFMSCYDDTLIVIDSKDVEKAMKFLNF